MLEAVVEVGGLEGFEAAGGEGLAGEGGEDGAMDDGLAQGAGIVGRRAMGSEETGHGTEEGIAGTGGIGDVIQRPGGTAEDVGKRLWIVDCGL